MDQSFGSSQNRGGAWWAHPEDADRLALPTILVVEDEPDIRSMLATLLEMAGYNSVTCGTAELGLEALREQAFDAILTDYSLPHHTGVWLLERAKEEGLIEGVPVLIVTAHPEPAGADEYEVIRKPFDLDELVERVRRRMDGGGRRQGSRAPAPSGDGNASQNDGGNGARPEPIELILYVSAQSVRSAAAIANIRKALSRFSSTKYKLTVCDLSRDPARGSEDSVAFTPTLVRRSPGPRTFILGHISNPDLLMEVLGDCEPDEPLARFPRRQN